jgi:asparagine synthase (glutamine-hydrolysing)
MQDHYLGNLMLGKLEQLSGRLGIEARCPYAAPPYVHFVYNIPARCKVRRGEVKAFFRAAIADVLPDEIIHRPKQGFRTPAAELFRGGFGRWAEPYLLETGLVRAGLLRREPLAALLAAHRRGDADLSTRLWTALVLNLWHERWIAPARVSATCSA